jgi:hypothetical protein
MGGKKDLSKNGGDRGCGVGGVGVGGVGVGGVGVGGVSSRMTMLLLVTMICHSLLFASNSLASIGITTDAMIGLEQDSTKPTTSNSLTSLSSVGSGGGNNNAVFYNNYSSSSSSSSASSSSSSLSSRRPLQKLPHWRMAVDCSVYSLDCFSHGQRKHRYLPYPLPPTPTDELTVEIVREFPKDWSQILQSQPVTNYSSTPEVTIQDQHNLYPAKVEDSEYQKCLDFTGIGNDSDSDVSERTTLQQLDEMLKFQRLTVEPDTSMIAFTISDSTYVHDMIHDMFQMMDHVVGFSQQHFVLIAIDVATVQMACRYGYPVIFWRESKNEGLRNAIANTKVVLSFELVKRGIAFFFTEMDVWWIQSPKPSLMLFQQQQEDNLVGNHLFFSSHQNNPKAANIGVYAAKANKYTQEYFEICIDVLKQRPKTHDQWAMQQVHHVYQNALYNRTFELFGNWGEEGPPPVPKVNHPFQARLWSPHEIVADERPTPTLETMAIHTLCIVPLLNPHGKKMMARELGVYYGFRTEPSSYITDGGVNGGSFNDGVSESAGYYTRLGDRHRRYVVLDGPIRTNFYSTCPRDVYHRHELFQWVVTLLMVIAKWSDRILILPQVFWSGHDSGS